MSAIRSATNADASAIQAVAHATGMFLPSELDEFAGMLSACLAGSNGPDHLWFVVDHQGITAAAYVAPEVFADGVWNLYFIGVHPDHQGQGQGQALLSHVETVARTREQRMLLIDTSGLDAFTGSRAFYAKNGYEEEARIRDYYAQGDDKIVFRKVL